MQALQNQCILSCGRKTIWSIVRVWISLQVIDTPDLAQLCNSVLLTVQFLRCARRGSDYLLGPCCVLGQLVSLPMNHSHSRLDHVKVRGAVSQNNQ